MTRSFVGPRWDDVGVEWDDPRWTWDGRISIQPEGAWVHSISALSGFEKTTYRDVLQSSHRVGSWLQVLDENERPLWEIPDVTDGGVSFDISQSPDRTLDVTVLDVRGRLLTDAPSEEAAEARRFVRAIYEKETHRGWMRFPLFTGPLSAGGLKRQGAEVSIRASGKESLNLGTYLTWEAFHRPKGTKVVDVIHDFFFERGERRFRLPELDDRLAKRVVVARLVEGWPRMQQVAARAGHVLYFDGEGYLSMRPAHHKDIAFVFDPDVVLTPPEVDDDYTTLINQAETTGPDPTGPQKPLHVPVALPTANPFSPTGMARNGVPRRSIATDQLDKKKLADLTAHSKSLLKVPTKQVSFDCLPVPHLRPGMPCRIVGEYEEQPIDESFVLRSGFFPLTCNAPMTVGTWKPIAANWRAIHHRQGASA